MPYKRRYKRRFRRRRRRRSKYSRKLRYLARVVNPERKYLHTARTQTAIYYDTTSAIGIPFIAGPSQSDSVTGRIGNKIIISGIYLRYILYAPTSSTDTSNTVFVRVMVIKDKQINQAQVSLGAILEDDSQYDSIASHVDPDQTRRFWTMYDRVHRLDSAHRNQFVRKYLKCKVNVQFSGSSGGYNNCVSNGIWFVVFSTTKDSVTATNNPAITYSLKTIYTDS